MKQGPRTGSPRPEPQSAAASGTYAQFRAAAAPALRPVCDALRALIAGLDPARVEIVWLRLQIASYGIGPRKMTEHYTYLGLQRAHVNLGFYHGAALPDPAGLLEGTGKNLRHVKIREAGAARNPALRALLRAAIAERRIAAGRH